MNREVTKAIILSRTNFGEADRIVTVLTPDFGKLSLMAKGVRKVKSKLAGGIELFSVSQITFIKGRGEVNTLISSRLENHFSNITKNLERTQLGYDFLKLINKNTEDSAGLEYFELLGLALATLNDLVLPPALARLHFEANLLVMAGHAPNLSADADGQSLEVGKRYSFDTNIAGFSANSSGQYSAENIKFLRLVFSGNSAKTLARVTSVGQLASTSQSLVTAMLRDYLRV